MGELPHSTVGRPSTPGERTGRPTEKLYADHSPGGGITLSTQIAWAQGASSVVFRIPPSDFAPILLQMMMCDASALHGAYTRIASFMPDQLVNQAKRDA